MPKINCKKCLVELIQFCRKFKMNAINNKATSKFTRNNERGR